MFLDQKDLEAMVMGPQGQPEAILKGLDSDIVTLKRQVGFGIFVTFELTLYVISS
jgi:hypothetical protein